MNTTKSRKGELYNNSSTDTKLKHYLGHRNRLKQKWLQNIPKGFLDYELLELLLFYTIPRKDVKPLAKKLLDNFSTLNNLFFASKKETIELIEPLNKNTYILFSLIAELIDRVLKNKIKTRNIISSWANLLDYLTIVMGNLQIEQFRVLFLNKNNYLISDEILATGTVDQAHIYPREIIKQALYKEASAIVLVHNHPGGNNKPSKADIELTKKIVESCNAIGILVHDHIIISTNQYFSFKSNMLL